MAKEPREQFVLQLLEGNWSASNTFDLVPSLLYASRDEPDSPHVTFEQPDEGPIGGGATGFSHIHGDGTGPGQTIGGTVTVHAFANDSNLEANSTVTTGSAAEYLTGNAQNDGTVEGGVVEEIYRIIDDNNDLPTNPTTGNQPVNLLWRGTFRPGPTDKPDGAHQVGTVSYIYRT